MNEKTQKNNNFVLKTALLALKAALLCAVFVLYIFKGCDTAISLFLFGFVNLGSAGLLWGMTFILLSLAALVCLSYWTISSWKHWLVSLLIQIAVYTACYFAFLKGAFWNPRAVMMFFIDEPDTYFWEFIWAVIEVLAIQALAMLIKLIISIVRRAKKQTQSSNHLASIVSFIAKCFLLCVIYNVLMSSTAYILAFVYDHFGRASNIVQVCCSATLMLPLIVLSAFLSTLLLKSWKEWVISLPVQFVIFLCLRLIEQLPIFISLAFWFPYPLFYITDALDLSSKGITSLLNFVFSLVEAFGIQALALLSRRLILKHRAENLAGLEGKKEKCEKTSKEEAPNNQ